MNVFASFKAVCVRVCVCLFMDAGLSRAALIWRESSTRPSAAASSSSHKPLKWLPLKGDAWVRPYLQGVHQLLPRGDVGDVDCGAEGVQHLHLLQHVLPAGGADDEQLPALWRNKCECRLNGLCVNS